VVLAVRVRLPMISRPVAVPVMAKLVIKGTMSASRLWLARRMATRLAAGLPGREVHVTADSAYAGQELRELPDGGRMTIRPDKTIFQVATAGHIAERIVSFLYEDATVALDRKAASAARIATVRKARIDTQIDMHRSRITRIERWYWAGASLKSIGLRLGVSDVMIMRWMEEARIPRRPQSGGRQRRSAVPAPSA
jgi:hypothetical protein